MRARISATQVLLETSTSSVVGYYTLAAASIAFDEIPEPVRRKARLSRYPQLSAVLVARLARHQDWQGQGLGELLIVDAMKRAWTTTAEVGAAFIIVDAIDQRASEFYMGYGFVRLDDADGRLFLPMATLDELFR